MSSNDLIDRRVTDALNRAHDDPRWAGSEWTDPVGRVRRAARSGRALHVGVSAIGITALGVGAGFGLHALSSPSDQVRVVSPAGAGGQSQASGLDWLMTPQQFDTYMTAHPSPSPTLDLVASPAPASDELLQLEADARAAMPGGLTIDRADAADGGERGHAVIWATRADGTQVVVERYKLDYPLEAGLPAGPRPTATPDGPGSPRSADEVFTVPRTWTDGSAYTALTGDALGYSTGAGAWNGPFVWTATSEGWFTSWTAPVSTERLLGWAQAADAHFTAG
jgi:hypothetical protein